MDDFSKYLFAVPQKQSDSPYRGLRFTETAQSDNDSFTLSENNMVEPKDDILSLEKQLLLVEKKLLERNIQISLLTAKCRKEIKLLHLLEDTTSKISQIYQQFKELSERYKLSTDNIESILSRSKKVVQTKENLLETYFEEFMWRQCLWLKDVVNLITHIAEQSQKNLLPTEIIDDDSGHRYPVLETNCMRNVREICEELTSHYYQQFFSSVGLESNASPKSLLTKEKIQEKLVGLLTLYPSAEIFNSLLVNIQDSSSNLKDITSRINLQKDAEDLRFKFETDQINDLSNKSTSFQTVPQLVEECQKSHFQRYLSSEKSKNESWKLKAKLKDINHQINIILDKECTKEDFKLYRSLFDAQQMQSGLSSSSKMLETERFNLENEKLKKEEAMVKLTRKYERIQNFESVMRAKQSIIQKLIKENSSAKSLQLLQVKDISTFLNSKLVSIDKEIDTLCSKYIRLVTDEVERFMEIHLSNVHAVQSESENKLLLKDLSIHRISPDQPGNETLELVVKSYECLPCATSDTLLENMKKEYQQLFQKEVSSEQSLQTSETLNNAFGTVNSHLTNVKSKRSDDKQKAIPSLARTKLLASNVITESVKFQNAAKIWWDAPAQHTVPWILEDGVTLRQYQQQFTKIANKIKAAQF